ncbi:MAG: hypothetical protein O7D32_00480 [bacterium]|nr:hypothetical protein [bacterium]
MKSWITMMLLVFSAGWCSADTVVLMNGDEYRGSVSDRRTLNLNPLSLRSILISNGTGPDGPFDSMVFKTRDVRQVILVVEDAKQIIDFEVLRAAAAGELDPEFYAEDADSNTVHSERDPTPVASDSATQTSSGRYKSGLRTDRALVTVAGGAAAIAVGLGIEFGSDEYSAVNYVLVAGGAALITYGIITAWRRREADRVGFLSVEPDVTGGAHIVARFRF